MTNSFNVLPNDCRNASVLFGSEAIVVTKYFLFVYPSKNAIFGLSPNICFVKARLAGFEMEFELHKVTF
jgi:hypothetical protein